MNHELLVKRFATVHPTPLTEEVKTEMFRISYAWESLTRGADYFTYSSARSRIREMASHGKLDGQLVHTFLNEVISPRTARRRVLR